MLTDEEQAALDAAEAAQAAEVTLTQAELDAKISEAATVAAEKATTEARTAAQADYEARLEAMAKPKDEAKAPTEDDLEAELQEALFDGETGAKRVKAVVSRMVAEQTREALAQIPAMVAIPQAKTAIDAEVEKFGLNETEERAYRSQIEKIPASQLPQLVQLGYHTTLAKAEAFDRIAAGGTVQRLTPERGGGPSRIDTTQAKELDEINKLNAECGLPALTAKDLN